MSLPPRRYAVVDGQRGGSDLFRLLLGHLRAQTGVVAHLHPDRFGDFFLTGTRASCLFWSEERIEKTGGPGILAQFAMLQEHVHCFPERVIEHFDQFLVDERRRQ